MELIKWSGCHPDNFRIGRRSPGGKIYFITIHLEDGHEGGTRSWFNTSVARRLLENQKAWDANPAPNRGTRPTAAYPSSAGYGIDKDGSIEQFVKDSDTSFHAGKLLSTPPAVMLPLVSYGANDCSIGIEHAGFVGDIWTDAMVKSSSELIAYLCNLYSIPIDRQHILGHREVSPDHPLCPGLAPLDGLVALAKRVGDPPAQPQIPTD